MKTSVLLLASLLTACAAPAPRPSPALPPDAASPDLATIVVPIHASLAPLVPLLESQVPKIFEKTAAYELDPKGRFAYKYRLTRDAIALNMQGTGLHVTTTLHYALEGCSRTRNPINGTYYLGPCLSCGFGEPMREAAVALHSHLDWAPDWTLRSRTTARPVEFTNRCKVTFARVDITDWKLAPLVNQQLQDAVRILDRNAAKVAAIRPQAEQIWSALQAPYEIAPGTWLVIEPAQVSLAPIRGSGLDVTSALSLRARTRVVVGAKPSVHASPLPPLAPWAESAAGIRIPLELQVGYPEASRMLMAEIGKRAWPLGGGATLRIDALALVPRPGGRLGVDATIDYRGGGMRNYAGEVHLEGTPVFDAATATISASGLDYTLDARTKNPLKRAVTRLAHDSIRAELQKGARWPVADRLEAARADIVAGMSRPLASGVALRGRIDAIQPLSVSAGPAGITIRVVAQGAADVVVSDR